MITEFSILKSFEYILLWHKYTVYKTIWILDFFCISRSHFVHLWLIFGLILWHLTSKATSYHLCRMFTNHYILLIKSYFNSHRNVFPIRKSKMRLHLFQYASLHYHLVFIAHRPSFTLFISPSLLHFMFKSNLHFRVSQSSVLWQRIKVTQWLTQKQ